MMVGSPHTNGNGTARLDERPLPTAPAVVSQRGPLRMGLPGVYQDNDFAMRFVGALETVLDPLGATLDSLHHYLDPELAPRPVLDLMCAWLGLETEPEMDDATLRRLAQGGAELSRRRGTKRGLELAFALRFPELKLKVEDERGVSWPGHEPSPGPARFVVTCATPISPSVRAQLVDCIARETPVHVSYKLRGKITGGDS